MTGDTKSCWRCKGSGDCPVCDGVGESDCHECGVGTIRCDDCDETGECWWCDGTGVERVTDIDREKAGQIAVFTEPPRPTAASEVPPS